MAAWLGPAITAGGGIVSALIGRQGGDEANAAAILNYQEQQRANRAREALAREQFNLSKAPVVSPTGSSYGYNPATGAFETNLSPRDQILLSLQQGALAQQMGPEEGQRQVQSENAFKRGQDINSVAQALYSELDDELPFTADEAYGSANLRHTRETNRLFDRGMESLLGGMRARGETPTGALVQAIRERSEALRQGAPSRFDARVDATTLNEGVRNNRLNRFLQAAGNVRNPGGGVASLPGLDNAVNVLGNSRGQAASGAGAAAAGIQAPQIGQLQPDNTNALRVGAISSAAGGLLDVLRDRGSSNPSPKRQRTNVSVDNSTAYSPFDTSGTFTF